MHRSTLRSRNAEVGFKGEKRSHASHASTTDPEARIYKKAPGVGAMLCFIGHALMENRHGLIVQGDYRGVERVRSRLILTMAVNNLVRLSRLLAT